MKKEKLMPSHENGYESSRYKLLESTKTKRLESWDNEYAVHYGNVPYRMNNKWTTKTFNFLDEATRFYDSL